MGPTWGAVWTFVAIPSVRPETGVGRRGEDDLMAGLRTWSVHLASNMIAQNPSATSKKEAPICSGPILGA